MHLLLVRACAVLVLCLLSVPAAASPAFAAQDPAHELDRLNQQLSTDQARLGALNNDVEMAEARADELNRTLAQDQRRSSELRQQIASLARVQYERPALTLSTILEAPTIDRLLGEIAQARLVGEKQRRLHEQAEKLQRHDQQTRDEQAAIVARIKTDRDQASQVAARTLVLRNGANDAVLKARAEAVAAQARATQAAAAKPAPPPQTAPAPQPASPPKAAPAPPPASPPKPAPTSPPKAPPAPPPGPPANAPPPPGAIVEPPGANHFAYGYCTYYVAGKRNVPWFGNAIEWWPNARPYGYAEGQTPVVGAIMVTSESSVGHVAYVEAVNGDGSWTVSEMNFKAWNVVSSRTLRPGQAPVVGFIYGRH